MSANCVPIKGCEFHDTEDSTCGHCDNVAPECHIWVCPLLHPAIAKALDEDDFITPGEWESAGPVEVAPGSDFGTPSGWTYVKHNFEQPPYEGELNKEYGIYPKTLGEGGPIALVSGKGNARMIALIPTVIETLRPFARIWISPERIYPLEDNYRTAAKIFDQLGLVP